MSKELELELLQILPLPFSNLNILVLFPFKVVLDQHVLDESSEHKRRRVSPAFTNQFDKDQNGWNG